MYTIIEPATNIVISRESFSEAKKVYKSIYRASDRLAEKMWRKENGQPLYGHKKCRVNIPFAYVPICR